MQAHIDHDRVELVLDTLLLRYRNQEFPYNLPAAVLPQNPRNMSARIKEDPSTHAMWLFCLCYYMRGGIKSVTAAQQLVRLFYRRPDLFNAHTAAQADEESIRRSLIAVDLKYLCNTVPHFWIENAQRLCNWYDGDVRAIFDGVEDYDQACDRICNRSRRRPHSDDYSRRVGFCGFQHKMVSMLIYYLSDAGLIKEFPFAVPVDFHVMRVSVATEMVVFDGLEPGTDVFSEDLRRLLRNTFLEYAIEHNVNAIEIADVLWLLSSSICGLSPGNITRGGSNYAARSTILTPHEPTWGRADTRAFQRSCAQCPVSDQCAWDIPNAYYTMRAQLIPLRARSKPAALALF